jgi:shikimate dehydrogenase
VLPFLDEFTPSTRAIGAANTLYWTGERLVGENTDAPAFLEDLNQQLNLPAQGKALVLGAGGAARACAYALAGCGWQVYLAARQPEQAQNLARDFAHLTPAPIATAQPLPEAALILSSMDLDLVVNATPAGMQPREGASPWPEGISLPAGCSVYDLVYNPVETQLLQQARRQGLPAAGGLGMLIQQAALAFLRWTGIPIQRLPAILQAMRSAI